MQEDGSLVWADTGEPVEAPVGFPAGARVILTTPNGHHEITGVEIPKLVVRSQPGARWRAAMFKRREAIERRLKNHTETVEILLKTENSPVAGAVARLQRAERDARAYNAMAEEMGLPRVRYEVGEETAPGAVLPD